MVRSVFISLCVAHILFVTLSIAQNADSSNKPLSEFCSNAPYSTNIRRHISVRVATFNAALNRRTKNELRTESSNPDSSQIQRVAATIQIINPDILLLNEVDYDETMETYHNLRNLYFSRSQKKHYSSTAIKFPYYYAATSNTGVLSGVDINNDTKVALPADAFGFGFFPGQYAFVIFSKFPIETNRIRTFQKFLWKDMPENLLPTSFYSARAVDVIRLSSKNHVDIPIELPTGRIVHVLASHPTPPVFDSKSDENGRRNADEIRFWADYITPGRANYIYDDNGGSGGLRSNEPFFICGDLNNDPYNGYGRHGAIATLLSRYNVIDPLPSSPGGAASNNKLSSHTGDPKFDTSFFNPATGNLRVDYVIPSSNVRIDGAHVFWPAEDDVLFRLVNGTSTSDHRAVFIDVSI